MQLINPIKLIVDPVADFISRLTGESGTMMLTISIILLFVALRYIVINLKVLVIGRVEAFFDTILFKTAARALVFGIVLTIMVQSSSITTSLAVPLAGAGISVSTLSVDTSNRSSLASTQSPGFLCQTVSVPSVTVSPSCGMTISIQSTRARMVATILSIEGMARSSR